VTQVMTVTGPVDPSELGMTLMHEHLFINLLKEYRRDGLLHDVDLMCEEVARFRNAGGGTIVDVTSEELGRNPAGLRTVSQRTGVKIVMGCGHYRDPYLDRSWFDRTDADSVAKLIEADIMHGAEGTDVRSGIIGEIGADRWYVSTAEERSFRGAARAQDHTGLTITTHAARWTVGRAQLKILLQEGADPRRIIIGHCDSVPDLDYQEEIARNGSYVEFDTIRGGSEYDLDRVVSYVMNLFKKGFENRILLSHDVCLRSQLSIYGGCSYDFIPVKFVPRLKEAGLSNADIETLLIHNPRQALTGEAA
jgi:phosphotriesterase-related protein